ncbi:MAG: S8 family serine peptidase, partial [Pseudomonadota bacterium]
MTMRVSQSKFRGKAGSLLIGALVLIGLTACDQREERQKRAETLFDAAVEQFQSGGAAPLGLQSVTADERAIAGKMTERFVPMTTRPMTRFAIGSVVCKPKEWKRIRAEELAEIRATRPVQPIRSQDLKVLRREELNRLRQLKKLPEKPIIVAPTGPKPDINRLPDGTQRDISQLSKSETVKLKAQALMLTTLDKYGLSGQVATRDDGEIMVLVGADAIKRNQFTGDLEQTSFLMTENDDATCPTDASPESLRNNPVLATSCVIKELEESGEFEYVEKDFIFEHQFARLPRGSSVSAPNDPLWELQWNLRDPGSDEGQSLGGAGFEGFWTGTETQGSRDITIATVDTGVALDHPDFINSLNMAPGWDMVSDPRMGNDGDGRDSNPEDPGDLCDPTDPLAEDSFHGTHVAGTLGAAATNNRAGIAGAAWDVKIVPVRALGKCGGRMSDINDAIRWAGGLIPAEAENGDAIWNENPADVINLSIGLFRTCPTSLQDAIDAVTERGAIVVA